MEGARIEWRGATARRCLRPPPTAPARAHLPEFGERKREKTPLMILAQKDGDFSFMPFSTQARSLDLSRFDTGGVENAESRAAILAYLFSDRGIYRPGETTHLGFDHADGGLEILTGGPYRSKWRFTDSRGNGGEPRYALSFRPAAFDEIASPPARRADRNLSGVRLPGEG